MKKILCMLLAIIFIVCISGCNNQNTNNASIAPTDGTGVDNATDATVIEPSNAPEVLIPKAIKAAKETLGDEYYPSVDLSEEEIVKMFNFSKQDYEVVFGQISETKDRYDLLIGVKATGDGKTVENLFFDYVRCIINDENVPENIRAAFKGCLVSRDDDGYVYLIGTIGNISAAAENGTNAITVYAETNCLKVSNAISNKIH